MTYNKQNTEWKRYLKLMADRPQLFLPHPDYKLVTMDEDVADYERKHKRKLGVLCETPDYLFIADLVSYNGKLMVKERFVPNTAASHILIIPITGSQVLLFQKFSQSLRNYIECFPDAFTEAGFSLSQYSIRHLSNLLGPIHASALHLGDIQPNTESFYCTTSVFAVKMRGINLEKRKNMLPAYRLMSEKDMSDYCTGSFAFPNRDSYTIAAWCMYQETRKQMQQHPFFQEET
uniref:hypothetical protein n=1 Tax=Agathobacter sp. TaxID=2021311 RepID=UPI004055A82B